MRDQVIASSDKQMDTMTETIKVFLDHSAYIVCTLNNRVVRCSRCAAKRQPTPVLR